MGSQYAFDNISESDFDVILSQYPETVPSKLSDLEEQRLLIIPSALAERKTQGGAFLTKAEVATLVDWKLSHGTFRPSLKGLVQQNSEDFVKDTTATGFSTSSWNDGLNTLTKLRGIGPATAALLLSTSDPETLPFFSDELFRWSFWESKTGAGWDRKIKYSLKEYRELKERVDELRKRTGKAAIEAEKVAYVLGKGETDLGASDSPQKPTQSHTKSLHKTVPSKTKVNPTSEKRKNVQDPAQEIKQELPQKKRKQEVASTAARRITRSTGKTKV